MTAFWLTSNSFQNDGGATPLRPDTEGETILINLSSFASRVKSQDGGQSLLLVVPA